MRGSYAGTLTQCCSLYCFSQLFDLKHSRAQSCSSRHSHSHTHSLSLFLYLSSLSASPWYLHLLSVILVSYLKGTRLLGWRRWRANHLPWTHVDKQGSFLFVFLTCPFRSVQYCFASPMHSSAASPVPLPLPPPPFLCMPRVYITDPIQRCYQSCERFCFRN